MLSRVVSLFTSLVFSSVSLSQTVVPGSVPGDFSVSGGVATYSVPIAVAPGRGGMQPEVSLSYSSAGGNGLMWGNIRHTSLSWPNRRRPQNPPLCRCSYASTRTNPLTSPP